MPLLTIDSGALQRAASEMSVEARSLIDEYAAQNELDMPEEIRNGSLSERDDYIMDKMIGEHLDRYLDSLYIKNRCSFSEYRNRWLGMHVGFANSGYTDIEAFKKYRDELTNAYMERFCDKIPVTIVADNNPNQVLCIIPPVSNTTNTIRKEDEYMLNSYAGIATLGTADNRKDIIANTSAGLMQAVINANRYDTEEDLERARQASLMNDYRILLVFNPEHPFVKLMNEKMQAAAQQRANEQKQIQQTQQQPQASSTNNKNVLNLEDDDLF